MKSQEYYHEITRQLARQFEEEQASIQTAAEMMSDTIAKGGLIHVFGSGHSQMFALELFYRSGGLVPINAMLYPQMAVAPMAKLSTIFERMEGFGQTAFESETVTPHDTVIVASVSGRNGSSVDMALAAKAKGLRVIALTSKAYSSSVASRHSSGLRLFETADVVIDLKCPMGDASLHIDGVNQAFAPTSTVLGMAVLEAIVSQTVENLVHSGHDVPLWVSANLDGDRGKAINEVHFKAYQGRLRFL